MKWRDFDKLTDLIHTYVPLGAERTAVDAIIERQVGEYKRVQRQGQINRGQRDKKTGRLLPQPAKRPKRKKRTAVSRNKK